MWLVLCSPEDCSALWAACRLRDRGVAPTEVVSPEALLLAPFWDHRIRSDGSPTASVRLHDGRTLEHSAIRGVLNRVGSLPAALIGTCARDEAYLQQERAALLLSWLSSLRNVINEATPQGLAGTFYPPVRTEWLAAAAGLAVRRDRHRRSFEAERATGLPRALVVVFDGKVFGPRVLAPFTEQCSAYARIAKTRLVGLEFVHASGAWAFEAATPMPNLKIGGAALMDALATAMKGA